jgi:hypothetical protein
VTLETNSISSESLKKIYRGFILGRPSNEGDEVKEILSGLAIKKKLLTKLHLFHDNYFCYPKLLALLIINYLGKPHCI